MWFYAVYSQWKAHGGNLYRDVTMQYFRYNASWSVYVKCRRRIVSLLVVPLAVVGVVSFHVSLTHGIQYGELSAISSYTSRHSQHSRHVMTASILCVRTPRQYEPFYDLSKGRYYGRPYRANWNNSDLRCRTSNVERQASEAVNPPHRCSS